jgi:hypothetical protein
MADIAKVKRNIQKMIDQGAPETDIDAYVASEGTTPEELQGKPASLEEGGFEQFKKMVKSGEMKVPNYDLGRNFQALDDLVRKFGTGATYGFGDKIAAGVDSSMGQGDYQSNLAENRQKTQDAGERTGYAGDIAEISGAMLPAVKLAGAGVTAARLPEMVGRYGGMALDGAGFGALNAAGHDQDIATGAGIGAAFGAGGQLVSKGVGGIMSAFKKAPVGPNTEALKQASQNAYAAADDAGLVFKPEAFTRTIDDVATLGQEKGIGGPLAQVTDKLYPKSKSLVEALSDMRGQSPRLQDVEMAKRVAQAAGEGFDADATASQKIAKELHSLIDNASPDDFSAGNVAAGIPAIQQGRDKWGRFLKSKKLDKAIESAKDRVGANYTQAGLTTALRQEMKAIKKAPDFKTSWTPTEQKIIKELVRGKTGENVMRLAGLFAPKGVVSGAVMGALGTFNAPLALALTGITHAGRAGAAKVGMNRFGDLQSLVSTGKLDPKLSPAQNEKIKMIVRALMAGGITSTTEQIGH